MQAEVFNMQKKCIYVYSMDNFLNVGNVTLHQYDSSITRTEFESKTFFHLKTINGKHWVLMKVPTARASSSILTSIQDCYREKSIVEEEIISFLSLGRSRFNSPTSHDVLSGGEFTFSQPQKLTLWLILRFWHHQ